MFLELEITTHLFGMLSYFVAGVSPGKSAQDCKLSVNRRQLHEYKTFSACFN